MGPLGIYHRLSVASGLEKSTVLEPGDILTHTLAYLAEVFVSQRMDTCAILLKARDGLISLEHLSVLYSLL